MPLPLTPIRFLYRASDLFADRVGIVSGDRQFTYAQFLERAERLAAALASAGVAPGDRVAYLSLNNHQLIEGYYGVPMAQGVLMPLNVRLSPSEFITILNHAEARILFYEPDFAPLVEPLRANCPAIQSFIPLNDEYEAFIAAATPSQVDFTRVDENSMAELFYTSGSTGTPKGVMLSHRTVYLHGVNGSTLYTDPTNTIDLHTIPLFHANGWGRAHASTMMGLKQVMVRRFDPAAVLALIQLHRATDMSLVPTMAGALLQVPNLSDYDLSSMRQIMIGGAAASPELIKRMEAAFRCRVCAGYGLTETAPVLTMSRPKSTSAPASEEERYRRQAMAGWAVPGVEIRVVDTEMRDVPRDGVAIGEVVARGDHIMSGYYRDEAGTKAVMAGGWFHTGDMAVWDTEGYIHIVDRKKEIIVSGGENISSIEVERAVSAHPDVVECAVVSAPDQKWGEVPVAVVVRKQGSRLSADELLGFLEGRLGRFKMPRTIEFSDDPLPKTGTGKIRKMKLREKYWVGRLRRVGE
jgi:fatty-acyl-CoA synthase